MIKRIVGSLGILLLWGALTSPYIVIFYTIIGLGVLAIIWVPGWRKRFWDMKLPFRPVNKNSI